MMVMIVVTVVVITICNKQNKGVKVMMIMTNVYYNKITFQQNNKSQEIHDFF